MAVKQRLDTPTNNFATFNNLSYSSSAATDGNLKFVPGSTHSSLGTTLYMTSGKFYLEYYGYNWNNQPALIFFTPDVPLAHYYAGSSNTNLWFWRASGQGSIAGWNSDPYGYPSWSTGQILGILIDFDNDGIFGYVNGSIVNSGNRIFNQTISNKILGVSVKAYDGTHVFNFGQDPTFAGNLAPTKVYTDARGLGRFYYEPPVGALALCTANLGAANYKSAPTSYVSDETNTKILTYNGNVEQVPYSPYATDGYSMFFNNGSHITFPHGSTALGNDAFTVECWVYYNGISSSTAQMICHSSFELSIASSGQLSFNSDGETLNNMTSTNSAGIIPIRKWTHIVATRDGSSAGNTIRMFVDGILVHNNGYGYNFVDNGGGTNSYIGIKDDTTKSFNGYIADFRIVKGSVVTAYSTTSTTNGTDIFSNNLPSSLSSITGTELLLSTSSNKFEDKHDTSSPLAVTPNSGASIEAWSPYTTDAIEFGTTYRTPETAHEIGSFSFDGTGDYIETSGSFPTSFGDWTVEMWVYLKDDTNSDFISQGTGSSDAGRFALGVEGGNWWTQVGSQNISVSASTYKYQWTHVAAVQESSNLKLYLNGTLAGTVANSSQAVTDTGLDIGRLAWAGSSTTYDAKGYVSDIRIVNGKAVYTGAFTPPSGKLGLTQSAGTNISAITSGETKLFLQPYKSYDADNLLTSNFSYERDSSSTPKSLTYVNDTKIVDESPYKSGANGSFSVTGNNNLILDDSDDWDLGTSFTVECWFYGKGSTSTNLQYLMSKWENAKQYNWYFTSTSAPFGQLKFEYDNGSNSFTDGGTFTTGMVANRWYHLAFVNNSGTTKLYINGVAASGTGTIGSSVNLTTDKLRIFRNVDPNKGCNALIADFRIAKGKAVYTTNFTPPHDSLTTTGGTYASSAGINNPSTSETVLLLQPGALASNDPAKKPFEHFKCVTWTGQTPESGVYNSDGKVTTGMSSDLVWIKSRDSSNSHNLNDSVRGVGKFLMPNSSSDEQNSSDGYNTNTGNTTDTNTILRSFDADGFNVGNNANVNDNGNGMVAWCWKAGGPTPSKTYYVKVVADGGNKYRFIDDVTNTNHPTLSLQEGGTYTFDQSDSSNGTGGTHPLKFSTTSNGTHGGGSQYTTGVTTYGSPGSSGAYTQITVASGAPTLYYYCTNHSGMGGQINTTTTHGQTEFGGSIIPIVSANKEAGFSIAKWVGDNTNNASISHGLTKTPDIVVLKNTSDAVNWGVKLNPNTISAVSNEQQYLYLNLTNPFGTNTNEETQLTSSLIKFVGTSLNFSNGSGDNMIAYCWHSVPGFSAFGSYTANNSADGAFVYTGFKTALFIAKRVDTSSSNTSWVIFDNARNPHNAMDNRLYANKSASEGYRGDGSTSNSDIKIDFLSNGVKIRSDKDEIGAGDFIYMAFAEAPVNFSNAR